ncbi:ATP-binding protein [uncultured Brachyspira sp.]|uniref:ATP-dependent nuclease n=1 Tax=uncultured Brachyspira sp. TaxID=221953 RepID=UPI002590A98C|nr:ATP-binding protein [uncultured Brachyspira sp.]
MQLKKIVISNFRSIKNIEIEIKEINGKNCIILVGKNEAGKSNILKAIAAVFGKYQVSIKDQRKEIGDESIEDKNCYVRAVFSLNENDIKKVINDFKNKYQNTEIIKFKENLTIENFTYYFFNEILWRINIGNENTPSESYWIIDNKKYSFDKKVFIKPNTFIFEENGTEQEILSVDKLKTILFNNCIKDLLNNYECIFWEYKSEYLLPPNINIEEFKSNPDISIPLKNIFYLSDKNNIEDEIEKALKKDNSLDNLLEKVSEKATKEFKKVWKDLKDTEFVLRKDGDNINVFVKNKVKYSCEDRSDGFKRFLAILIMLSTQSRINNLNDKDIILIDEPDTCLYPTSARFLRDELLNISKNSIVIYSTHSPFMIDTKCIERHLVIEKESDISNIKEYSEKSPYTEDELIRRAIGTDIFETIKQQNLLFEGYTDCKLFEKISDKKDFQDCGKIYLGGIKEAKTLSQMVMLANKQFVIISDSDKTSIDKKNDFIESYPDFKDNWIDYSVCGSNFETLEDFYKIEYIDKELKKYNINIDKSYSSKNAIEYIEYHIKTLKLNDSDNKEKKNTIKYNLAINATKNNMKDEYFEFIEKLKENLKRLGEKTE